MGKNPSVDAPYAPYLPRGKRNGDEKTDSRWMEQEKTCYAESFNSWHSREKPQRWGGEERRKNVGTAWLGRKKKDDCSETEKMSRMKKGEKWGRKPPAGGEARQ